MLTDIPQETIKLRVCYIKQAQQVFILRLLLREARACVQFMARREPQTACWAREWLERANEQLEEGPR